MKWAVEIQKTSLEERNLKDLLTGLGLRVVEGIDNPAITSPEIEQCVNAQEVWAIAKCLRAAFTGPAKIDEDFELGYVIDFEHETPKRHGFLEAETGIFVMSGMNANLTVNPPSNLSEGKLEQWHKDREEKEYQCKLEDQRSRLEPAYLNEEAAKVLEILAQDNLSGEALWKVFEICRGHKGEHNQFLEKNGITEEEFHRFEDAVHNPHVHGDWARHARGGDLRSSNPMSQAEAQRFVELIARKWMDQFRG